MGAYNWVDLDATCPSCGRPTTIRCQTHAAASFEGDHRGRFNDRTYRLGERMAWWDRADSRFDEWRVNGRKDGVYPSPLVDEEACYSDCTACKRELYVVLRFADVTPEAVVAIGESASWPSDYFS